MQYFAHRKFLVHVEKAEDDGFLDTLDGLQAIQRGDNIAVDEYGNRFVVPDRYFLDNYVPVKKMRKTQTTRKSPFEIAYAEQLVNFSLENNVESDEYIRGTQELVKNKAF